MVRSKRAASVKLSVFTGARVFTGLYVFRVQNYHSKEYTTYHIIFVGEVFQIEISDGLVHPLGSRQNVSLCPAVVITGAQIFRSLYAFRVQKDHSNDCTKYHVCW